MWFLPFQAIINGNNDILNDKKGHNIVSDIVKDNKAALLINHRLLVLFEFIFLYSI